VALRVGGNPVPSKISASFYFCRAAGLTHSSVHEVYLKIDGRLVYLWVPWMPRVKCSTFWSRPDLHGHFTVLSFQ
jgi:hypothetical protein